MNSGRTDKFSETFTHFAILRTLTAHNSLTVAPRALKIDKSSSLAWNSLLNGLSPASLAALFAELQRFSQGRPESGQH